MADSATKFLHILFLGILFLAILQEAASDCYSGHRCFDAKAVAREIHNRKVLYGLERKEELGLKSSNVHGTSTTTTTTTVTRRSRDEKVGHGGESLVEGSELRKVPSGPDPLHHNGGSPKKPRTP
ncbi:hypothetical protein U1Q18_025248 [Sarracenia purpurea var. burkii]